MGLGLGGVGWGMRGQECAVGVGSLAGGRAELRNILPLGGTWDGLEQRGEGNPGAVGVFGIFGSLSPLPQFHLQELELQAQIHGLPLNPPMAEGGCEEPSGGGPPFLPGGPPTPQCLLELPPGLALPLALGGPEGTLEDILMDDGGGLSPLGPPGALLASPGPSRASSPRSSLSMEDEP